MILELLAQDWTTNGSHCSALALRAITVDPHLSSLSENDPIARLVGRVLTEISQPARQVLSVAAVLGNRLNDVRLYAIADLGLRGTMEGLSELVGRRVLRDMGGTLEFSNELLRAHAYRSVPHGVRIELHSATADRLLDIHRVEPIKAPQLEIAWHLMRAHRQTEAAKALISGARTALLCGAPDEVVLCLQNSTDELDEPAKTEAQSLLATAMHELGRWEDGLAIAARLEGDGNYPIFRILATEARWRLNLLPPYEIQKCIHSLLDLAKPEIESATKAFVVASFMAGALRNEEYIDLVAGRLPTGKPGTPHKPANY